MQQQCFCEKYQCFSQSVEDTIKILRRDSEIPILPILSQRKYRKYRYFDWLHFNILVRRLNETSTEIVSLRRLGAAPGNDSFGEQEEDGS